MKKIVLCFLLLCSSFVFGKEMKEYEGKAGGFSGEIQLKVKTDGEKIEDIQLISNKETSHIISRAFPILKERILKAQSPIVDSVSGATYTSTGVKRAVGEAMKKAGKDFGRINFKTSAPEQPVAYLEPVTTDLVIVGGGPAGLAAAISARENGLKNIILIEKLDILSGNGKFDMNFFDLINSEAQKKAGINDSVEKFIKDSSNDVDSPERVRAQAEGSYVLDKWLREMGIELNYCYGERNHMAEADAYAGAHIQDKMEEKVKSLGIDVRTGTKGLDLIVENGKIAGVKVQNKNNFYDIKAKAVIIATGGFSYNKEMLKKYAPGSEIFQTSNQLGATGDFVPVFEKNNLKMANMDKLSIFAFVISKSRDLTGGGQGFILVNRDGNRFMKESDIYVDPYKTAKNMYDQKGKTAFYIYDQNLYDKTYRLQKHYKQGLHTKANSLDELAEKLGINKANLKESVVKYEKELNRDFADNGPYYGVEVESAIHMTKGGVVANEKTQVINNDNEIVEGLYAAGEVTNTKIGAYSAAVIFGRIAGEEAAKYLQN